MDSEAQEKATAPATDTNGSVAQSTASNLPNESDRGRTDADEGSLFQHAGLEGSGIHAPRQL
jgi:hypothetical protein